MNWSVLRTRALLALGLTLIAVAAWQAWRASRPTEPARRVIATLPLAATNESAACQWASTAVVDAAELMLPGDAIVRVENVGEAAARNATHLAQGSLACRGGRWSYSFALESMTRHTIVASASGQGTAIDASKALATLLGGTRLRPMGVNNDGAFEQFAQRRYSACTELDAAATWCWLRAAEGTLASGDRAGASAIVAQARQRDTRLNESDNAHLDLIDATARGDANARIAALARAVRATPDDIRVVSELAQTLVAAKRLSEAQRLYQATLQRAPQSVGLWNELAYLQAWQGKFNEARASLAQYERMAPMDANAADSRGEIEMRAGDLTAAERAFAESVRRDAQFNAGAALEKAALCAYFAGRAKEADELAARYIAQRGQAGDALAEFHRARWHQLMGRTNEAATLLQRIVARHGPDAALAALRLALIALRDGDARAARGWIERIDNGPAPASALLRRLGEYLVGDGKAQPPQGVRATRLRAVRATLHGEARTAELWRMSMDEAASGQDGFDREMLALVQVDAQQSREAATTLGAAWPVLEPNDRLLFDFLAFPDLLYNRASAMESTNVNEARRLYEAYLRYAGTEPARRAKIQRSRAASRL